MGHKLWANGLNMRARLIARAKQLTCHLHTCDAQPKQCSSAAELGPLCARWARISHCLWLACRARGQSAGRTHKARRRCSQSIIWRPLSRALVAHSTPAAHSLSSQRPRLDKLAPRTARRRLERRLIGGRPPLVLVHQTVGAPLVRPAPSQPEGARINTTVCLPSGGRPPRADGQRSSLERPRVNRVLTLEMAPTQIGYICLRLSGGGFSGLVVSSASGRLARRWASERAPKRWSHARVGGQRRARLRLGACPHSQRVGPKSRAPLAPPPARPSVCLSVWRPR